VDEVEDEVTVGVTDMGVEGKSEATNEYTKEEVEAELDEVEEEYLDTSP
jgi:basic membrane lipoprotein Med (substrate-binding protein (PBP1-ABC) superfamily)